MTTLIIQYERDIKNIRRRLSELKAHCNDQMNVEELNLLHGRIELLETEMYEMMYSLAGMRRLTAPKPPTPSMAACISLTEGDAAC